MEIEFRQANAEFQLIDWIHESRKRAAGIVINPAALTHTSVAVLDALNTKDEVGDLHNLEMWLDVNGERMQTGSTSTMIFDCAKIVSYLSECMTLMPGDLVCTGTPPGVGMGMKPPRFLKAGDVMTLGIEKLGEQRQRVVSFFGGPS